MFDMKEKTYDFVIQETRFYTVQGSGTSKFGAQQEAVERFHRLTKSGEIVADRVTRPVVIEGRLNK